MADTRSREQKRRETYQELRRLGFSADFARKNRNNFALVSKSKKTREIKLQKFKNIRRAQIDRVVKEYYVEKLGLTPKEAAKRKSRRKMVWKDTLEYIRRNEIRLENEPRNTPIPPEILHDNGVKLLANTYHYLHPKEQLESILDQIDGMPSDKIVFHQYRLERFIITQDDETVKAFIETLNSQSELDDYYKSMDKHSGAEPVSDDGSDEIE